MLGKLIKQELKITSRYFLPMYVSFIVATLLLKLSFLFSSGDDIFVTGQSNILLNMVQGLMIFVYVVLLIGTILLTYFIIIKRFYSNMFGDEGYLMFTLPVTTRQLLNSKLISSLIWLLIMAPMNLGSFFLLFLGTDAYNSIGYYSSFLMEEFQILQISGFHIGVLVVEIILGSVLGTISSLLMIYLAITLGHHFWSDHRLLGSIIFYFLIGIVQSILESIAGLFTQGTTEAFLMSGNMADFFSAFNIAVPLSLLCYIIMIVTCYLLIHYFLDKKLNLS